MKRLGYTLVAAAAAFAAGCGKDQPHSSGVDVRHEFRPVEHSAPLSRALPETTLAYVRIPSLNDLLFAPKQDGLSEVQQSDAMQAASQEIMRGLVENVVGVLAEPQKPLANFVAQRLTAPVEIAFVESPVGSVAPDVLIRTKVADTSTEDLASILQQLAANAYFTEPFDDDGNATLMAGPSPAYMHYEDDTGVLRVLSGFSATAEQLAALTDGSSPTIDSVAAIEEPLDSSGRGISMWINMERWWPSLEPMVPPTEMTTLNAMGIDQIQSLWLGSVSRQGRSEMQFRISMPVTAMRTLLPPPDPLKELEVAPGVQVAGRLHVPSRDEFESIMGWISGMAPEAREGLSELDAKLQEKLGVSVGDLLGPGGDVVFVSDAAGWWSWADSGSYEEVRDALTSRGLITTTARSLGNVEMEELRFDFMSLADDGEQMPAEAEIVARVRGRSFLARNGGGYLVADVPQVLARREAADRVPLSQWLDSLGLDWGHASVAFAGTLEGSPIKVYDTYLTGLGYLASLADVPLDLTRFPVMPYPDVPDFGRIGMQVDSTPEYLAFRLQYETSPVELVFGSGYESIAVIGILAAIAVPAYQDYTIRAKLSMRINAGAPAKMVVAEHYYSTQSMPSPEEISELLAGSGLSDVSVDEDGDLAITISDVDDRVDGGTVWLSPILEDEMLTWSCFSDIESRFLPAQCR